MGKLNFVWNELRFAKNLINTSLYEEYREKIGSLFEDKNISTEKLHTKKHFLMSFRLDKKIRAICTQDKNILIIIDILTSHKYDKVLDINSSKIAEETRNELDDLSEDEEELSEKILEYESKEFLNSRSNFLVLDKVQSGIVEDVISLSKPSSIIVNGVAGSGKTTIAESIINHTKLNHTKFAQTNSMNLLYICKSSRLISMMKNVYSLGEEFTGLDFITSNELYKGEIFNYDIFLDWVNSNYAREKFSDDLRKYIEENQDNLEDISKILTELYSGISKSLKGGANKEIKRELLKELLFQYLDDKICELKTFERWIEFTKQRRLSKYKYLKGISKEEVKYIYEDIIKYKEQAEELEGTSKGLSKDLGKKVSYGILGSEELSDILNEYVNYLKNSKKFDFRLGVNKATMFFDSKKKEQVFHKGLENNSNKNYTYILIDESQDLSQSELIDIRSYLKKDGTIIYLMDSNQTIEDTFSRTQHNVSVAESCYSDRSVLLYNLDSSYRNAEIIARFATRLIHLKSYLVGGKLNKYEGMSDIDSLPTSQRKSGEVRWIYCDQKDKKTIENIEALKHNARSIMDCCVVIPDEDLRLDAETDFPGALVLTPSQIKGLEYNQIILYKFISGEYEANILKSQSAIEKYKAGQEVPRNFPSDKSSAKYTILLNKLFVGATRAMVSLVVYETKANDKGNSLIEKYESIFEGIIDSKGIRVLERASLNEIIAKIELLGSQLDSEILIKYFNLAYTKLDEEKYAEENLKLRDLTNFEKVIKTLCESRIDSIRFKEIIKKVEEEISKLSKIIFGVNAFVRNEEYEIVQEGERVTEIRTNTHKNQNTNFSSISKNSVSNNNLSKGSSKKNNRSMDTMQEKKDSKKNLKISLQDNRKFKIIMDIIRRLYNDQDYDKAADYVNEPKNKILIEKNLELIDPSEVNSLLDYHDIGIIQFLLGGYKKALESFELVKEMHSNNRSSEFNIGFCYYQLGMHKKAIEKFILCEERSYKYLMDSYGELGMHEKHIKLCKKYIDKNPDDYRLHTEMGDCLFVIEKYDEASKSYNKSFIIKNTSNAIWGITKCYFLSEKYQESYDILLQMKYEYLSGSKTILGLNEQYIYLSSLYLFALRKYDYVIDISKELISTGYRLGTSFYILGISYKMIGNYKESKKYLEKAAKEGFRVNLFNLHKGLILRKEMSSYLSNQMSGVKDTSIIDIYAKYCVSYTKTIIENFETQAAISLLPDLNFNLGLCYLCEGRFKLAGQSFMKELDINPKHNNSNLMEEYIDKFLISEKISFDECYDQVIKEALSIQEHITGFNHKGIIFNLKDMFIIWQDLIKLLDSKPILLSENFEIGNMFYDLSMYREALLFYRKDQECLKVKEKLAICYKDLKSYQEAINIFNEILSVKKDTLSLNWHIGHCYELLKQYNKAISSYKKELDIYPKCGDSHYQIGYCQMILGSHERAKESFIKARNCNPTYEDSKENIKLCKKLHVKTQKAIKLLEDGQFENASNVLEEVLSLHPENLSALNILIICMQELKLYKRGHDYATQAIEIFPSYWAYYMNDGEFLKEMFEKEGALVQENAIEQFKKALEINPKAEGAYYKLAECYQGRDDKKAKEYYELSIKSGYRELESLYNVGVLYTYIDQNIPKDFKKSIEYFNKVINIDPEYKSAYLMKGISSQEIGLYEQALLCFNKYKQITGINCDKDLKSYYFIGIPSLEYLRGICFKKLGRYKEAIESFENIPEDMLIFDDNENPTSICYYRGECYEALGEYENAIESYKCMHEDYCIPNDNKYKISIFYKLGECYEKIGKYNEAIKSYEFQILKRKTDIPGLENKMVQIYDRIGKVKEAINLYAEILKSNPSQKHLESIKKLLLCNLSNKISDSNSRYFIKNSEEISKTSNIVDDDTEQQYNKEAMGEHNIETAGSISNYQDDSSTI